MGRAKHCERTLDQIAELMPGMLELKMVVRQRDHVMYHGASRLLTKSVGKRFVVVGTVEMS